MYRCSGEDVEPLPVARLNCSGPAVCGLELIRNTVVDAEYIKGRALFSWAFRRREDPWHEMSLLALMWVI